MMRLMLVAILLTVISACDVSNSMREASKKNPKAYARVLAADNGCLSCHSVSVTVVGPGWKLVSRKYKNQPGAKAFLINKIKKGGKGNWDQLTGGLSMPAHEDRMSDEEIGLVVDYILAL